MFACDHAQGFFISRVLRPDAFAAFAKCLSNLGKRSARRGFAGRAPPAAFLPDWAAPIILHDRQWAKYPLAWFDARATAGVAGFPGSHMQNRLGLRWGLPSRRRRLRSAG